MFSRMSVSSIVVVLLLLTGGFVAGCGGGKDSAPSLVSSPVAPTPTEPQPSAPPASVSTVLPERLVPDAGTQPILVMGANFQPGLTVAFSSASGATETLGGSAIQNLTDSSFQVGVVAQDAGTYSLRVINPSATPSAPTTIVAQPTTTTAPMMAGISPASPTVFAGSQTLYLAGNNFLPGLTVTIAGPGGTVTISGSAVQKVSSTLVQLAVVFANVGNYYLRVVNPDGRTSEPWAFTVKDTELSQRPSVTGLSPASPVASTATQGVYVIGTNFQSGLTVALTLPNGTTTSIGGTAILFGSATAFKLSIVLADAGNYQLRVTSPDGQKSEPLAFTVKPAEQPGKPTVTGVTPTTLVAGTASQSLYVLGTGFQSGLTATFTLPNGTTTSMRGTAILFGSATAFKLSIVLAEAGTYQVCVTNPDGQKSEPSAFAVKPVEQLGKPTVTGISPRTATAGTATQYIYVAGTNFRTGLTVALTLPNGTVTSLSGQAIVFGSATDFKVYLVLTEIGSYQMRVVNSDGQSSEPTTLTVVAQAQPTVSGVSPTTLVAGTASQPVYVLGTGFQSGLSVTFTLPSGTSTTLSGSAIQFGYDKAVKLSIVLAEAGTYQVRVINPDGQRSEPWAFAVGK